MSVPVWGVTLSGPLPVVGLVRRYRTNYLMGRSPLRAPRKFLQGFLKTSNVCGISSPFGLLSPARGQVDYVLRTRSPLSIAAPFDLHVLGTPPAFILSQDQTLRTLTSALSLVKRATLARALARPRTYFTVCAFCHCSVVNVRTHRGTKNRKRSLSVGTELAKHPASLETIARIYAAFVIVSSWCELRTACALRFLI